MTDEIVITEAELVAAVEKFSSLSLKGDSEMKETECGGHADGPGRGFILRDVIADDLEEELFEAVTEAETARVQHEKLEAALALCVEALEKVEIVDDEFGIRCPWCDFFDYHYDAEIAHHDDCPRERALAAAKGD